MMKYANKVRLTLEAPRQTVVMDQDGPRFVTADRVKTYFRLPGVGTWHSGLIDTGAPLTVLPEEIWFPHRHAIEWVSAPSGQSLPGWLRSVSGLSGGQFICEPGLIDVVFFDSELHCLPPRRILAKCVRDGGRLRDSLIGLGGHVLEGCRLEIEYSQSVDAETLKGQAWLREVEGRTA